MVLKDKCKLSHRSIFHCSPIGGSRELRAFTGVKRGVLYSRSFRRYKGVAVTGH